MGIGDWGLGIGDWGLGFKIFYSFIYLFYLFIVLKNFGFAKTKTIIQTIITQII